MKRSVEVFAAILSACVVSSAFSPQSSITPLEDAILLNRTYTSEEIANGQALQYRSGDIILGVLIAQHVEAHHYTCGDIEPYGPQLMETVNMIIESVNANDSILPGVKLGTLALDTCAIDTHTVRMIVRKTFPYYWQNSRNCSSAANRSSNGLDLRPFAGFIGAGESDVTILSSKVLQVFQIPQISFWSTNPELSAKHIYPYVFRTVPSDAHQAEAMMKFIQSNGWNYVSVVYSDTLYGARAFTNIQKHAKTRGVCIAAGLPLPPASEPSAYDDTINKLANYTQSKVVILFAVTKEAERVLRAAEQSSYDKDRFLWIGSDGWTGVLPSIKNDTSYRRQLTRSIGFMPQASALPEFDEYFRKLRLQDRTGANSSLNPWFTRYLSRQLGCQLSGVKCKSSGLQELLHCFKPPQRCCFILAGATKTGTPCQPGDHLSRNAYQQVSPTHYISDAVLAFVHSLNALHKDLCKGARGLCDRMKCTVGTNGLATQLFHYMKNVSFQGMHGREFRFDENLDGPATYDLRTYGFDEKKGVDDWKLAARFENKQFTVINSALLENFTSVSSVCSAPCKPDEKKIILDKSCCWKCVKCSGDQQVVAPNGTECALCNETQEPNKFRNACRSLERSNLEYGSIFSIIPMVVSTLGIALTAGIAAIYATHWNTPIVKACSKELSIFVFVGVIICLLDGYVTVGGLSNASCATSRIILSIGPACMYSGLLTKTIRIVIIFQSKNLLKKHSSTPAITGLIDQQTFGDKVPYGLTIYDNSMNYDNGAYVVPWKAYIRPTPQIISTVVLIVLQIFILVIWFLAKPNKLIYSRHNGRLHYDCSGINDAKILIGLIYPLLLIIICTVLATINRNVPTGFKETRYVGFTMYTTCVIWLAFVPIVLSNVQNVPLKVMTTSVCLSLSAITVMAWLFVPRCYDIILRPDRNTPQAVMNTNLSRQRSRSGGQNDELSIGIPISRKLSTQLDPAFFPSIYKSRPASFNRAMPAEI